MQQFDLYIASLLTIPFDVTLKWACANGCEWNKTTCEMAAGEGHLDILKWARANGCQMSSLVCLAAARYGHLEVLRWARENNTAWDVEACLEAAKDDSINQWIIAYLQSRYVTPK